VGFGYLASHFPVVGTKATAVAEERGLIFQIKINIFFIFLCKGLFWGLERTHGFVADVSTGARGDLGICLLTDLTPYFNQPPLLLHFPLLHSFALTRLFFSILFLSLPEFPVFATGIIAFGWKGTSWASWEACWEIWAFNFSSGRRDSAFPLFWFRWFLFSFLLLFSVFPNSLPLTYSLCFPFQYPLYLLSLSSSFCLFRFDRDRPRFLLRDSRGTASQVLILAVFRKMGSFFSSPVPGFACWSWIELVAVCIEVCSLLLIEMRFQ